MREVTDFLGRDAFGPSAELVVHVKVERLTDRHFRAVLEVTDAAGQTLGTREITSPSELCSSLDQRLVLAVALLADNPPEPADAAPRAVEPRQQAPAPAAEASPERDVETVPREPPARPSWELAAEAALLVEAGLLPAVRPGVDVGLRLKPLPWLVARAGILGFWPASAEFAGTSTHFWLLAGRFELCAGDLHGQHVQTALCAGALYATLGTATHGVVDRRDGTRAELAGSLSFRAALPVGRRWMLGAGVTAVFPYRPERFVVQVNSEPHELFQMAKPALLASLGGAVTF